ncbi:hypothetical protein L9F63_016910 [Diploptera punctata]|uniref:G-protein coupled receptors family 1 profile domain-containing protein n=1 Tax=Diploptera punctata TaxID=6984 RepID=A0AAD8EHB8_DIPPU|nr:hypothetical protein L9F63_016910 [Diploptera punctata]
MIPNQLLTYVLVLGAVAGDKITSDVGGIPNTISPTVDEDDLEFSHEYTGGKRDEFILLLHLDESLNDKYRSIIEDCISPDENDVDSFQDLINQTNEYVFLRRRWLQFFKNSPQSNSETFHLNDNKIEIRDRQLREIEYISQSLKVSKIWKQNYEIYSILLPTTLKWGRGFDFVESENISETTAEYLKEFRVSFNDLQESMNILEKLKVKGFPIKYCFNESIPSDYMSLAYDILRRNDEIFPFHKTAVTFGKIIEPIFLVLITFFGLLLNCTLIYIFVHHKEIGNSKNLMVLNLSVIAILRIFVELPLFYQQTYFSRHFLVDSSLFNAFHMFFISSNAFSVLAFIIRQYKTMSGQLYESLATKRKNNVFYLASVIVLSLLTPISSIFFLKNNYAVYHVSEDVINFHIFIFVMFGIILPVAMAILSIMIARKLIKASRETNESGMYQQIEKTNRRRWKVGIALTIVYFVGNTPELTRLIVADYLDVYSNEYNSMYHFTDRVLAYLVYCTVCLYPVALYTASGSYRRLFKLYLSRCLLYKKQTASSIVQI